MRHAVIVLDDQKHTGEATGRIVKLWDPEAEVELVRSVQEAQQALSTHGPTAVAYVIVDLLLEPSSEDEQGELLAEWMLKSPQFSSTPVLILSAFPLMIKSLKLDFKKHKHIKVVSRAGDLSTLYEALKPFILSASQQFNPIAHPPSD